jgi:hypothetical protein
VVVLLAACTSTPSTTGQPATSTAVVVTPSTDPEPAPLVDAASLSTCDPAIPKGRQTVAFAAGGAIWAVDPRSGALTCTFGDLDAGPFAWGPLGDRLVAAEGDILELGDTGPFAIIQDLGQPSTWSKPTGRSFIYVVPGEPKPTKFPVSDDVGSFVLTQLPSGIYQSIAYHPSGTSMAVSVMRGEEPQIFLATNEGEREKRIVFGISATSFPSITFDAEGNTLFYVAEHKGGYVQLHRIDLLDNDLVDMWRSTSDLGTVEDLFVSPDGGDVAFTAGDGDCATSVAMRGDGDTMAPAIPDAGGPTHALGYLDDATLLVGVGGCGDPLDLYATQADGATWVVGGADAGATRAAGSPEPAAPLPDDLLGEIFEFG